MAPDETTSLLSTWSNHDRPESDEETQVTRNSTNILQALPPETSQSVMEIMIAREEAQAQDMDMYMEETPQHKRRKSAARSLVLGVVLVYFFSLIGLARQGQEPRDEDLYKDEMYYRRSHSSHKSSNDTTSHATSSYHDDNDNHDALKLVQDQVEWEGAEWKIGWEPPTAETRCEWVLARFFERDVGIPKDEAMRRYRIQSQDPNVFYRATAHVFWHDFVDKKWGDGLTSISEHAHLKGGIKLTPFSTWTWVTGDQHLSNFGAWRNRHNDVVFGVNDFDEAAIFDFHIDVLRIAVSITSHAVTNGLSEKQIDDALQVFTDAYVKTVIGYVGNEHALLFELRNKTAYGSLLRFIKDVEQDNSSKKQMSKFTDVGASGKRQFLKGPVGVPYSDTKLMAVTPERELEIRSMFTSINYGATMMKLGWATFAEWDDDFFEVLDVAERVGTGIGSFGVDRYFVLLQGTDGLLGVDGVDGTAVVLDVKFQPHSAVSRVLTPDESAWYKVMFPNEAARVVEAQRRLTSFTDPYTGWGLLNDDQGTPQPFSVRQRSPWKDSPDLFRLTDPRDFEDFMAQIAAATATSHVRGSVAKRPGDFKHVIRALLGRKKERREWGRAVARLAHAYRAQVLLDFECFQEYVDKETDLMFLAQQRPKNNRQNDDD